MTLARQALRRTVAVLVLVVGSVAAPLARADADLYTQLGGQDGMEKLVALFVERLHNDQRIGRFFVGGEPAKARERLGAQFCDLSGGPCKTIQPDMKKTHAALDIRGGDFDVFIQLLRQSMTERGVAPSVQDRFTALLQPMRTSIVNTP